jgi:3-oxoacyl-[acyl-carrier-protein] synthase-3
MAQSIDVGLQVRGIACAVPAHRETEADLAREFGEVDARRLVKGTGVKERRVGTFCTSDLCCAAAESLIAELGWARESVTHLVFVTQSADYVLPATACVLQQRLGLSTQCTALDVNLGCSGYTYGLWLVARILESGQRALLLAGDAIMLSPQDRSALPLFGHAGSATAVERSHESDAKKSFFVMGTDGTGARNIIIEGGHFRMPSCGATAERKLCSDGNIRSQEDLFMNGAEVFSFALQRVPGIGMQCMDLAGWSRANCDDFVFHQANGFMLKTLADKMDIPIEKVPSSLAWYGNTSSASIPLTLVACRREVLLTKSRRCLLLGFGVGWSWAAVALELGPLVIPPIIELS